MSLMSSWCLPLTALSSGVKPKRSTAFTGAFMVMSQSAIAYEPSLKSCIADDTGKATLSE